MNTVGDNQLELEIAILEKQLTGNLIKDSETREKIHKLKMELRGGEPIIKSDDSDFECIGCGS